MPTRSVIVEMPEDLYSHFEAQAEVQKRSVGAFVLDTLSLHAPPTVEEDLPPRLQMELTAMAALSDAALWAIGRSQMNEDKVALYDTLLERNQNGSLTSEGRQLLAALREEADSLMLRKAHAYALLKSRGHRLPSLDELRHQP